MIKQKRKKDLMIEFDNQTLPLDQWSKKLGIKYSTLYNRLFTYKWPVDKAFKLELNTKYSNQEYIEFHDLSLTMKNWAKRIGLDYDTLKCRLNQLGWSVEKSLTTPLNKKNSPYHEDLIEFNGKKLTLSEWSRRLGINRTTLEYRLNIAKWSIEKALSNSASFENHNMSKTTVHKAWLAMKSRCIHKSAPGWKNYGGRGITFCKHWQKFENFFEDMGHPPTSKHSLDRKDNNGNYEPGNCRWATPIQQSNNSRNNVIIEFNGIRLTMSEWARKLGMNYNTLSFRITTSGWSIEKALTTKVNKRYSHNVS